MIIPAFRHASLIYSGRQTVASYNSPDALILNRFTQVFMNTGRPATRCMQNKGQNPQVYDKI